MKLQKNRTHVAGFDLILRNAVVRNFATNLSLIDLPLIVEERKFYSKTFSQTSAMVLKINFLLKTSFLGKFKCFVSVFSIFNVNPKIVTMKAPKHLLNANEAKTCRNAVETYHVKMLNGLKLCSGQNRVFTFL